MAVYVDATFTAMPRTKQAMRYGAEWCHMWADSDAELHEMAQTIGLARSWFQARPGLHHYDLTSSKRRLALENGAIDRGPLGATKEMIRRRESAKASG